MKSFLLFAVLLCLLLTCNVFADTIYVQEGSAGMGSSWEDAFGGLQDGLDIADVGDEIWVAAGVYKPSYDYGMGEGDDDRDKHFRMKNDVGIYGGFNGTETALEQRDVKNNDTILSGDLLGNDDPTTPVKGLRDDPSRADNCHHIFYHAWEWSAGLEASAILDGFTITAANNHSRKEHDYGGGMNNEGDSPTITNCTFTRNSARHIGGGMYNLWSSPTVTNCTFMDNSSNRGGGMYNQTGSNPKVTNCTFIGNLVFSYRNDDDVVGGGMYNGYASHTTVTNCTFTGNFASRYYNDDNVGSGGGMCNGYESNTTVTNCTFTGNSADYSGGGMYNREESRPIVTNCTFSSNSAGRHGGGMLSYECSPIVTNCTFTDNSADISGGGTLYGKGKLTMTNCILWGNTAGNGNQIALYHSSIAEIDYCDIQGGLTAIYDDGSGNAVDWGEDNIDVDPMFTGNYHLQKGSLCIDAGDNSAVTEGTDLDGNVRIMDGDSDGEAVVDMGAYEFVPSIEVSVKFTPRTLNCSSNGNWVKGHFTLPEGYSVEDVDAGRPATIDLLGVASDHVDVSYNSEGLVEVEAVFVRSELCALGLYGDSEFTVRGRFADGTGFHGTDTIRITTNKLEKLPDFLSYWLDTDCSGPGWCGGYDIDGDGAVDLKDFVMLE